MIAIHADDTFPLVTKLGDLLSNTARIAAVSFFSASLIIIVILLVWSHISDRDTGRYAKALAVWVIAAAIVAGGSALYSWASTNLTI